jgi:hypothetical protein
MRGRLLLACALILLAAGGLWAQAGVAQTGASGGGTRRLPDGTSGAPIIAFALDTATGIYRIGSGQIGIAGSTSASGSAQIATNSGWIITSKGRIKADTADGNWIFTNNAQTAGAILKVDALPTVASGFGVSPAVTALSTPLAGSVNVGTGGVASSGVLNFNGTAFPQAPFVVCTDESTVLAIACASTTTQLTITAAVAFTANDVISWIAISRH